MDDIIYRKDSSVSICKTCHRRIVKVQFALGPRWRHQPQGSAFQDNMYEFCRVTVAEPVEE